MESTAIWYEQAACALKQSNIPVLRRIALEHAGDALVMTGRVPSYYHKQLAQEAVMPHLAGRELMNRIVVVRQPS